MTTLFSHTTINTATPIDAPRPRKKRGWLPLLTVLFCISYGMMTMLIVEQGSTIESQRSLIRELFRDSTTLAGIRQKAQQERALAAAQTAPGTQAQSPSAQIPSTQAPVQQAPSTQVPSTQASPKHEIQKSPYATPSRPAADLGDARRALITI